MYPRFLQFGSFVISTYGVLALVAAWCGIALWASIGRRIRLDAAKLQNAGLLAVVAVVLGARLAVVVANWRGFLIAPLLVLRAGTLNTGSAAAFGALLACVAAIVSLLTQRMPLLRSLDAAAPALALAAGVLDIADFAAGSRYGSATTLPWGVTYTSRFAARTTGVPLGLPLHPVQIYAAAGHFAIAVVLVALLRHHGHAGEILGAGLFLEGLLRFLLVPLAGEYPTASTILGVVTSAQAVAMLMVVLGGALWLRRQAEQPVAHA